MTPNSSNSEVITMTMTLDTWQDRKVNYESIHKIREEDFKTLLDCLQLGNNQVIGDFMGGYGAVTREICTYARDRGITGLQIVLNDRYPSQLERSYSELSATLVGETAVSRHQADIRALGLTSGHFDRVAVKMGLHEIAGETQQQAVNELYRVLKPGGIIAIWDVLPANREEQVFFKALVRKKDELAGFDALARERYFCREDELKGYLAGAGFADLKHYDVPFRLETHHRLDAEFKGDQSKLDCWNEHIRNSITEPLKSALGYADNGHSLGLHVRKGIISARKPESLISLEESENGEVTI
jgi:ubiquinone/menaquinone biosynthesis C-methylase UbiE